MPPLPPDNDASDDDISMNGAPNHTESAVEADIEAKDQLKEDLVDDVKKTKGKKAARAEKERVTSPEDGPDEDGEEVFEVEAIHNHEFRGKKLFYNVKWKGYPVSDNTLEPEANLLTSSDILAAYHHKIGGAPQPPSKNKNESLKKKASRKSLRGESGTSAAEDSPAPPAKRQKRTQADNSALSDDLDAELDNYQPKGSNWENQVKEIQTVERDEQSQDLFIFLEFHNGKKSRVKNGKIRSACPQKLLDFYEAHLSV